MRDSPPTARIPDVAVIGGGIVGTSAAAFLAQAGARVVVYERDELAAAASGRNSGVVQRPFDPVLEPLYRDTLDLYRGLEADGFGDLRLGSEPAGLLLVSFDPAIATTAAAEIEAAAPGSGATYLDPDAARRLEPGLAAGVAACRVPIGYPVPPAAATRAFGQLARRRGVAIREGTAAYPAIEAGRVTGVRVGRPDGAIESAGLVLVAAGPWTPELVDATGSWRPIRPLWGVVVDITLASPPGHVLEEAGIDASTDAGGAVLGPPIEFSLVTAAGRSGLGSTFLDDEPDTAAFVEPIVARGARFVPAIAAAPIRGVRRCARPLSMDGSPLVGPAPAVDGLWVAAGHGPWGISTGPATARMVADAMLGTGAPIPAGVAAGRFGGPGERHPRAR